MEQSILNTRLQAEKLKKKEFQKEENKYNYRIRSDHKTLSYLEEEINMISYKKKFIQDKINDIAFEELADEMEIQDIQQNLCFMETNQNSFNL